MRNGQLSFLKPEEAPAGRMLEPGYRWSLPGVDTQRLGLGISRTAFHASVPDHSHGTMVTDVS